MKKRSLIQLREVISPLKSIRLIVGGSGGGSSSGSGGSSSGGLGSEDPGPVDPDPLDTKSGNNYRYNG
ncbi:MAG: hypothetical protein WBB45_07645 [Cyclobacteriaceae bacterium]